MENLKLALDQAFQEALHSEHIGQKFKAFFFLYFIKDIPEHEQILKGCAPRRLCWQARVAMPFPHWNSSVHYIETATHRSGKLWNLPNLMGKGPEDTLRIIKKTGDPWLIECVTKKINGTLEKMCIDYNTDPKFEAELRRHMNRDEFSDKWEFQETK